MERIKEALEKARIERQRSGGGTRGGYISPRQRNSQAAEPISYTKTRIAKISRQLLEENRVIHSSRHDVFTDSYGMLRTQVLQRMVENNWNVLAVTSPNVGEGKSLTAINLAISVALEMDYSVLLVDADLRKPGIHSYFGLRPEYGLTDYLASDTDISDLLIHPDVAERFVILPGGNAITNSSEMLSSPKMKHLVKELKTRYSSRFIIFDVPPLLSTADALAFSPYVDAALLVIEEGATTAEDAKYALDLLQGTNILGTVLNKADGPLREGYFMDEPESVGHAGVGNDVKGKMLSLIKKLTGK